MVEDQILPVEEELVLDVGKPTIFSPVGDKAVIKPPKPVSPQLPIFNSNVPFVNTK